MGHLKRVKVSNVNWSVLISGSAFRFFILDWSQCYLDFNESQIYILILLRESHCSGSRNAACFTLWQAGRWNSHQCTSCWSALWLKDGRVKCIRIWLVCGRSCLICFETTSWVVRMSQRSLIGLFRIVFPAFFSIKVSPRLERFRRPNPHVWCDTHG